jgi:RNA polymerase sigma-70 factor (ECF subfamily)
MEDNVETKEIWGQMHERLLSFINRHVATINDAEDILQEVFVRIHSNLGSLKDKQSVTAWVYQVARNAITDYHRKRAAAAGTVKKLAADVDDDVRIPHHGEATEKQAAEAIAELSTCMEPLVRELPEPYRQAIALTELDQLTQKDAAQELGLSISGMKSRVQRGRTKLKDLLQDCCNVELDRRRGVVDYQRREGGDCGDCDCR